MVDAIRPDDAQQEGGAHERASARHARHAIMPVRVNVSADGTMSAQNTRGGELPIGTGWDGQQFNPIEMLLAAIGGCAAIDFTNVLARRGHPLDGLQIEVRGRRASDERLEAIEVFYELPEGRPGQRRRHRGCAAINCRRVVHGVAHRTAQQSGRVRGRRSFADRRG